MFSYALVNLGCRVNRAELDYLDEQLRARGGRAVERTDAQAIVVNTCTVTSEAAHKSRKSLHHLRAENPSAVIVACGCAVNVAPDDFAVADYRVVDKSRIADIIDDIFSASPFGGGSPAQTGFAARIQGNADIAKRLQNSHSTPLQREMLPNQTGFAAQIQGNADIAKRLQNSHSTPAQAGTPPVPGGRARARQDLQVQDGCDRACAYCIVCKARGAARSLPREEVLGRLRRKLEAGVREVVLTGIDLGSYDDHGLDLVGLLRLCVDELERQPRFCRVRLSSIEPQSISDELLELMAAANGRICRHLHIPLQSGSDAVLQRMLRDYDSGSYLELIGRIRRALPMVALGADIIAGLPGERDQDHQDTLALCRAAGFMRMHVFKYSPREGTPAAAMDGQVEGALKEQRAAELRTLGEELRRTDARRRLGNREYVVCEQPGQGMGESYHRVLWTPAEDEADMRELTLTADGLGLGHGYTDR
jgi:threonylcarbamoyladenosine tRNA methylthiotransferase MtaB